MFAVLAMENNSSNNISVQKSTPDLKAMDFNINLSNENAELRSRVESLEGDVNSLTEQHQSLQNLIITKTKQAKELRDQISKLEVSVREAQGKLQLNVQQTGTALLLLEEEAEVCREEKEKAEKHASALQQENEKLRLENISLKELLKKANAVPGTPNPSPTPILRSQSELGDKTGVDFSEDASEPHKETNGHINYTSDQFIDDLDDLLSSMTGLSPSNERLRSQVPPAVAATLKSDAVLSVENMDMEFELLSSSATTARTDHSQNGSSLDDANPSNIYNGIHKSSYLSSKARRAAVQKMEFVADAEKAEETEGQAAGNAGIELLMARVLEARYTLWATSAQQKSASVLWSQAEKVSSAATEAQAKHADKRNRHAAELTIGEEVLMSSLNDMVEGLQNSFEQTRKYAINLDTRFEVSKLDLWAEVLGAVEPAVDDMEMVYATYDSLEIAALNDICDEINIEAKYIPGKTNLSQNTASQQDGRKNAFQDQSSVLTLYSVLRESKAVVPYLDKLSTYMCEVFPEIKVARHSSTTPISKCLELCLMDHNGNYSDLCDVSTCVISVPNITTLKECLHAIEALNVTARRRQLLLSSASRGLGGENEVINGHGKSISSQLQRRLRQPLEPCTQFSVVAVRNKFQAGYNARDESCGFRDCSIYMCLLNSPHPYHIVSLKLEVHSPEHSDMDASATSEAEVACNSDHWAHKLYDAAKPLRIFESSLRRHVGPVEKPDADRIRDGLCNVVNMDLFPLRQYGGELLVDALRSSPYGALQELSLENSIMYPDEIRPLFDSLTRHHRLKTLRLSRSEGFSASAVFRDLSWENLFLQTKNGESPRFPSLQKLDMSFQQIRSPLPPFISSMFPSLQRLVLEGNDISGPLPPDIGNITGLKQLILSRNKLDGPIPSAIGQLSRLQEFQAWQNGLSGEIPASIGKLKNLQRLFIDSCRLSGDIPAEIGDMSSLQELFCFDNELTGSIPSSISRLTKLKYLGLNGNHLRGDIPRELGQLRSLQHLFLHENELTGSIPPELGALSELTKLSLRKNFLRGSIPNELGNLFSLEALVLSDNQLSGSIPIQLGRLIGLEALSLSGNKLTGTIPSSFCSFTRIKVIELSSNRLSGSIPAEIGSLTTLESLLLSFNDLSGEIPSSIGNLVNLKTLELHGNTLQGIVPIELCNLVSLSYLDLSKNRLQGSRKAQFYLEKRLPNCTVIIDSGQEPPDK